MYECRDSWMVGLVNGLVGACPDGWASAWEIILGMDGRMDGMDGRVEGGMIEQVWVGGYLSGGPQSRQWQGCRPSCSAAPPAEHVGAGTAFCPEALSAPGQHCPGAHERPAPHPTNCMPVSRLSSTCPVLSAPLKDP